MSRKITSKENPIKAGVIIAQGHLWHDFAYSSATAGVEVLKLHNKLNILPSMAIYGVSIVISQEEINPVITGRHHFTFTQIN